MLFLFGIIRKSWSVNSQCTNPTRPAVREYEEKYGTIEQDKEDRTLLKQQYNEIQAELNLLKNEEQQAYQVFQEMKKAEDRINEAVTQLKEERNAIRNKRAEARDQLNRARDRKTAKMRAWRENRDFNKEVREDIAQGDIEGATSKCVEQVELVLSELMESKAAWSEYVGAWET